MSIDTGESHLDADMTRKYPDLFVQGHYVPVREPGIAADAPLAQRFSVMTADLRIAELMEVDAEAEAVISEMLRRGIPIVNYPHHGKRFCAP